MAKRSLGWLAAAGWAAVIFRLSAIPGSDVPGRFAGLAHFSEYAILGALLFFALRANGTRASAAILAIALASAYGALDELHQSFVPMRMPDAMDWLVDTAGSVVASIVLWSSSAAIARKR